AITTLSLHDALPIWRKADVGGGADGPPVGSSPCRPGIHDAMTIAASALTQQWEAQGFAAPLAVLSEDEVRHYREEFDRLEAREEIGRAHVKLIDRHFDLEFVWRLAHHPRVL